MGSELMIGALGWDHSAWSEQFYPDDLPPEWRLSYYANEFQTVVLPLECWLAGDHEQFDGWREDVSDRFHFVLDITGMTAGDAEAMGPLGRCQAALGDRLAGAVSWMPLTEPVRERVRSRLGEARFLAVAGSLEQEPAVQVAEDGVALCALVAGEAVSDLKSLRSVLESLSVRIRGAVSPMLFFSGRPPPIKVMREAAILWQLLSGLQR